MYVKEVGIAGIVILEGIALAQGINGVLLTMVIGTIAGIAGYQLGFVKANRVIAEDYKYPEKYKE